MRGAIGTRPRRPGCPAPRPEICVDNRDRNRAQVVCETRESPPVDHNLKQFLSTDGCFFQNRIVRQTWAEFRSTNLKGLGGSHPLRSAIKSTNVEIFCNKQN